MNRLAVVLVVVVALAVLGGGLFLAFWQPPVPAAPVEKILSNARFPK
jgi:hypothetical protein